MDYKPISTRTRAKRDIALLERYWEMKANSGESPARSKKMRRSNQQACHSRVGESSSRKQSFEWVADDLESLENQQNDDISKSLDSRESVIKKSGEKGKGNGAAVGLSLKRKRRDDSKNDGCKYWRVVSDNGVEVVDLMDSDDDEVVVLKGREGRGGRGVDDCRSDEDVDDVSGNDDDEVEEEVSSAEGGGSSDESEFMTEEDSTDEDYDEGGVSSSDEDSTEEEEKEEESEMTLMTAEKNKKECKEESVEVVLKEKSNAAVDDLQSSCGQDINERSETVSKGETPELVPEGKMTDVGDDLHSCSAHNADVKSEQVQKEESLGSFPKGLVHDDLHSCSAHNNDVKSEQVLKEESLRSFPTGLVHDDLHSCSAHNADARSDQVQKEENFGSFPKGYVHADGDDQHSSSGHDIIDRIEKLVQAESTVLAEERTGCDKSDGCKDGRVWKKEESVVGLDENRSADVRDQCKNSEGDRSVDYKHGERVWNKEESAGVSDVYKDGRVWKKEEGVGVSHVYKDGRVWKKEESVGVSDVYKDGSVWKKEEGVGVSLKERGNRSFDVHNHCKISEGDSSLTKKTSRRAPKQKRVPTVAFQPPKVEFLPQRFTFDKKPTVPEKSDFEREVDNLFDEFSNAKAYANASTDSKAKENNCPRSINTPMNDNGETYGGSHPEQYKKIEGVKKRSTKKGITAPKDCNAFTILLDSIYDKGEVSGEKLPHFRDAAPKDEAPRVEPLPLFFKFGHQPSPPPEKSAHEIEIDNLFDELKFARLCNEIGSSDSNVVEGKASVPPGKELTQHVLCSQGNHDLVLDEEIGLICRYCPHVHREIKYIVPEFAPNPYGKYEKRFAEEDNRSILDDLQLNDHNDSGSISHAPTEGTVWDLIPGVESDMYPHQREGFEFIWRHLAGGIQLGKLAQPSDYDGDGCIISHAPGTGKTRLTIIFIQSYMNFNPLSRPLIVAPRTMLLTWEEEFKKWGFDIPFHNINNLEFSGKEDEAACHLVKDAKRSEMTNLSRVVKLKSWAKTRSILGISYSLFEQMCGAPVKKPKHDSSRRVEEAEQMSKILLEFPGLVVFDEGHNPRNDRSYSWKSLLRLKTRRRIILSGTPFQNNFEELYNTVRLVRPEWTTNLTCLGGFDKKPRTSYQVRGAKGDAKKNQFADENTKRAGEVREMISPFVHVYKGSILQDKLPGLRNSVVVLQPTALQQRYSDKTRMILNPFKYERIEAKVTIHPSLLLGEEKSTFFQEGEDSADWNSLTEIKLNPEAGVKARFTVDLIRLCQAMNERVLVFSQWVDPLHLMRELLRCQFHWVEGEEVVYMDGKCDAKQRQSSMSYFNDPSTKAKVMLATTKGCNEGISLVGASRVVLLDVTWNPSVERQAISRAYRLGQKKIVSIYHLLMTGTREENKYTRQVEKHRLSELVFTCSDTAAKKIPAAVAEDKILEEMVQHEKLKDIFLKITLLDEASYLDEDYEF